MHIPKDERKKLDLKSKKCVLMGYGTTTKGYRLYDPHKRKVFFSRDVIFNEQKCGVKELTQQEPQKYVYLDYSDEPLEINSLEPSVPWRHSERVRKQTEFYGY